ncbi:Protein of unknown function [Alteromonadaceae bacterium Bs31]|nr:Protein of unknown function [Alteromonadaceae bacterium Bs31]
MEKPFSQACENNKAPILQVLQRAFEHSTKVLEIGSGTGQHASYFAAALPHLQWQPSDLEQNISGIKQWCTGSENVLPPLCFDIHDIQWPVENIDAVFSANTAHIMDWPTASLMIKRVAEKLPTGGVFALYGPFNYAGHYTSQSNADFDAWLKEQHPGQGIRNFEDLNALAKDGGLSIFEDNRMPANNRLLVWVKQSANLSSTDETDPQ